MIGTKGRSMGILRTDKQHGTLTVTSVTFDRAPANVLDFEHVRELQSCLQQIRADDRTRVLIFRGSGKCFSTGVEIGEHTPEVMPELLPAFHALFDDLLGIPAITIAALHGNCLGGAAEFAFSCDRIIAEEGSVIGLPEIQLGCYPPVAIPLLVSRIGVGRATEMILGGLPQDLQSLAEVGLIDTVCATGKLDECLDREINRYTDWSPAVVGLVARRLHEESRRQWAQQIPAVESDYLENLLPHPDCSEGIEAFLDKRTAQWQKPAGLMGPEEVAL